HIVLMCAAVNRIDLSALETLEKINEILSGLGIKLHLSEVKGPIMDRLATTGFFKSLSGKNYLSHNEAVEDLRAATGT
ncbi:MAG TPA: sodium-independent anion transporter, partial [Gammaproteobacteria bacterium]|nr:sodium-independent anion transporter [Gammaproteobacteria bacterium]